MQTVEQVKAAWNALDRQTQIEMWDEFTRALDEGMAGWHPYYLALMPMWERGEQPVIITSDYDFSLEYEPEIDLDAFPMKADLAAELAQYIPF